MHQCMQRGWLAVTKCFIVTQAAAQHVGYVLINIGPQRMASGFPCLWHLFA